MDIRAVTIEDHGVSEYQSKCATKVNTKLNDLTECDGYLLLVDGFVEPLNLSRFLDDSELKERLIEFLTFSAEENVEEIVNNSGLSL